MKIVGVATTDPTPVLTGTSAGCFRFWIRETLPAHLATGGGTYQVLARMTQEQADLVRPGWPYAVHGTPRARVWASPGGKPGAEIVVHAWDVYPLDPYGDALGDEPEDDVPEALTSA